MTTNEPSSCGVMIYANTSVAKCRTCDRPKFMQLNPKIFGVVADETGCLSAEKLVWSEQAWRQVCFPNEHGEWPDCTQFDVAGTTSRLDMPTLQAMEERWLYTRMTIIFAWAGAIGRICVWKVQW